MSHPQDCPLPADVVFEEYGELEELVERLEWSLTPTLCWSAGRRWG